MVYETRQTQAVDLLLAQQGDADAIATLINHALSKKGIEASAIRHDDCLQLTLQSDDFTDSNKLLLWMQKGLSHLNIQSLKRVKVIGCKPHAAVPEWTQEIAIQPFLIPEQPAITPNHIHQVSTDKLKTDLADKIEANIQAKDISGQVVLGNNNQVVSGDYNTVIGAGGSLIVNHLSAQQVPSIKPISLPEALKPRGFPRLLDRADESQAIWTALQAAHNLECYGPEGTGKTSLLQYSAHRNEISSLFPNGVIYLSALYKTASDLLQSLFEAFYETDIPFKPTELQVRRNLHTKKALVLIDDVNLERPEVQWLLNSVPSISFFLASQQQHLWSPDTPALPIIGLPLSDAITLFERALQRSLKPFEHEAARALCEHLKGHPLKILQAASLIRRQQWAVIDFVNRVLAAQLPEQVITETAAELPSSAKKVLAVLAMLAGIPLQAAALAEATGSTEVNSALINLQDLNWVVTDGWGYRIAENLVTPFQQAWDLSQWLPQLLNYFTKWVNQTGQNFEPVAEAAQALLKTMQLAAEAGQWSDALKLGQLLDTPLWLSRQWGIWEKVLQLNLQAAQTLGNQAAEALAMHQLGSRSLCLGDELTANFNLTKALEIREAMGDAIGADITRHNLGMLFGTSGIMADETAATPGTDKGGINRSNWMLPAVMATPVLLGALVGGYLALRPSVLEFEPGRLEFSETEVNDETALPNVQPLIIRNISNRIFEFQENSFTFDGPATKEFTVIENSCIAQVRLAPEQDCTLQIQFLPQAAGKRAARLVIQLEQNGRTQSIAVRGIGTAPAISYSAQQISFEEQEQGTTSPPQALVITNQGTAPLRLTQGSFILAGEQPGDFRIAHNQAAASDITPCPTPSAVGLGRTLALDPEDSCTVWVIFRPQAQGVRTTELIVDSNAIAAPPQLRISGTGIQVPRLHIKQSPGPFSKWEIGTTSTPQTLILNNPGTGLLGIERVDVTGVHQEEFSIREDTCSGQKLQPNSAVTCTVEIVFKPAQTGDRQAQLRIQSNAENEVVMPSLQGEGTAAGVRLSTENLSFGDQEVNRTSATESITVNNDGTAALQIALPKTSGAFDWSDNTCEGRLIAQGENCTINIRFTPTSAGEQQQQLIIESNALDSPHTVTLTGEGTQAVLTVPAEPIIFEPQEVGTTSPAASVVVNNSGNAPLRINPQIEGPSTGFTVSSSCPESGVALGSSCRLAVTFAPRTLGAQQATLVIAGDNARNSPQRVSLEGAGTGANIEMPSSINFGRQPVNIQSSAESFIIANRGGSAPLRIGTISIQGSHRNDFTLEGCSNITIEPNESCTVRVYFRPAVGGRRAAQLSVPSNAYDKTEVLVELGGQGILPEISVNPTRIEFGYDIQTAEVITVRNSGQGSLRISEVSLGGNYPSDFAIVRDDCSGRTLESGEGSCEIQVQFLAESSSREISAQLLIENNSHKNPANVTLLGLILGLIPP